MYQINIQTEGEKTIGFGIKLVKINATEYILVIDTAGIDESVSETTGDEIEKNSTLENYVLDVAIRLSNAVCVVSDIVNRTHYQRIIKKARVNLAKLDKPAQTLIIGMANYKDIDSMNELNKNFKKQFEEKYQFNIKNMPVNDYFNEGRSVTGPYYQTSTKDSKYPCVHVKLGRDTKGSKEITEMNQKSLCVARTLIDASSRLAEPMLMKDFLPLFVHALNEELKTEERKNLGLGAKLEMQEGVFKSILFCKDSEAGNTEPVKTEKEEL